MAETVPMLRQWLLLKMLSARRQGVTLRELAEETGCSQKTSLRDLALLKRVGFPLRETAADHGRKHWRLDDPLHGPALTFNWSEAISLYLGWRLLQPLAGTQFWEAANAAQTKVRAALGEQALRYIEKMAAAIHLTTFGTSDYAPRADVIDDLSRAIEDRCTTWLLYRSEQSTEPVNRCSDACSNVAHSASLVRRYAVSYVCLMISRYSWQIPSRNGSNNIRSFHQTPAWRSAIAISEIFWPRYFLIGNFDLDVEVPLTPHNVSPSRGAFSISMHRS